MPITKTGGHVAASQPVVHVHTTVEPAQPGPAPEVVIYNIVPDKPTRWARFTTWLKGKFRKTEEVLQNDDEN